MLLVRAACVFGCLVLPSNLCWKSDFCRLSAQAAWQPKAAHDTGRHLQKPGWKVFASSLCCCAPCTHFQPCLCSFAAQAACRRIPFEPDFCMLSSCPFWGAKSCAFLQPPALLCSCSWPYTPTLASPLYCLVVHLFTPGLCADLWSVCLQPPPLGTTSTPMPAPTPPWHMQHLAAAAAHPQLLQAVLLPPPPLPAQPRAPSCLAKVALTMLAPTSTASQLLT